MKKLVLFSFLLQLFYSEVQSQVIEKEGHVALEMESANSPLDLWLKVEKGNPFHIAAASGGVHLEFNGNAPAGGTAKSPLRYQFTINTAGTYRLAMVASKRLLGEAEDKCNE